MLEYYSINLHINTIKKGGQMAAFFYTIPLKSLIIFMMRENN